MPPLLFSQALCVMSSEVPNRPSCVRMAHSARSAARAQRWNSGRPVHAHRLDASFVSPAFLRSSHAC